MSRYIETEKAINTMVDCVAGIIPIALARHIIEHNSTEDLQPVVRGEWKSGDCRCPVCGEDKFKGLDADIWSDWEPNYCPNCGAKMV